MEAAVLHALVFHPYQKPSARVLLISMKQANSHLAKLGKRFIRTHLTPEPVSTLQAIGVSLGCVKVVLPLACLKRQTGRYSAARGL